MKSASAEKPARAVMGRVRVSYPRLNRILVPLDFSGVSRQALRHAVPIAQKFAARIVLMHVLAPAAKGVPPPAVTLAEARRAALKRLVTTGTSLIPKDLHVDNIVLSGHPAEQILLVARKREIDLIVMSTKGRSGLKRIPVGSTAESVVAEATCPVLSVRRH